MLEYFNYNNIFLAKNITEFLKYIKKNNHIIKLKKDKQLSFNFIYNLRLVKLKILKMYIKINLVKGFI